MGATYFVQPPPPGSFTPNQLIDSLNRYPIATLCAPPTIYRSLVTNSARAYLKSHPPKALRHCVGAGEPLNASVIKEWQEMTNVQIKDGWGQSETVIAVGNFEGISVREGSMGKVAPFFEVSIIDHEGRELADGEEGELAIRADSGAGAVWIFKGPHASFLSPPSLVLSWQSVRIASQTGLTSVSPGRLRQEWQNRPEDQDAQRQDVVLHGRPGRARHRRLLLVCRPRRRRERLPSRTRWRKRIELTKGRLSLFLPLPQVITSSGYRIGPFEVESALKVRTPLVVQPRGRS